MDFCVFCSVGAYKLLSLKISLIACQRAGTTHKSEEKGPIATVLTTDGGGEHHSCCGGCARRSLVVSMYHAADKQLN